MVIGQFLFITSHAKGKVLLSIFCYDFVQNAILTKPVKDTAAAEQAAIDYGQCIRDLANTNIFPGDLLPKNFGVTRHGRVIFYDYDELCRVTDCHFRDLPRPANPEDEMRAEAWFYVGEQDVFPETFINFLAFDAAQRAALLRTHGEIFTAAYWRRVQRRLSDGEVLEVLPYHPYRVRVASSA